MLLKSLKRIIKFIYLEKQLKRKQVEI